MPDHRRHKQSLSVDVSFKKPEKASPVHLRTLMPYVWRMLLVSWQHCCNTGNWYRSKVMSFVFCSLEGHAMKPAMAGEWQHKPHLDDIKKASEEALKFVFSDSFSSERTVVSFSNRNRQLQSSFIRNFCIDINRFNATCGWILQI